jgi:hypothetical protein
MAIPRGVHGDGMRECGGAQRVSNPCRLSVHISATSTSSMRLPHKPQSKSMPSTRGKRHHPAESVHCQGLNATLTMWLQQYTYCSVGKWCRRLRFAGWSRFMLQSAPVEGYVGVWGAYKQNSQPAT